MKIHKKILKTVIANKLDNLEEYDKFLETYNLSILNQEEIDNVNRPFSSSDRLFFKLKNNNNNSSRREIKTMK